MSAHTIKTIQPCLSCGEGVWLELPPPNANYSLSSDGVVQTQPFAKMECMSCGLIERRVCTGIENVNAFYTNEYDLYNQRPGAEHFETGRYPALSRTIVEAVAPAAAKRVLEIGCANGRALEELRHLWPDTEIMGFEPMQSAVREARVIDGGSERQFHGRPIYDYASLASSDAEVMVMAVNPTIQDMLAKRFLGTSIRPIVWHDVIPP